MHFLLLARGDLALEPRESAPRAETLARFGGVEVGHHRGEQLERLVGIDDPPRLGEQRGDLEVGREYLAVAVDEVGARGRDRVDRAAAVGDTALGHDGIEHETSGDDRIDDGKADDCEAEPRLRLDRAVDVAAVEQRLEHPPMPAQRRRGGCGLPGCGEVGRLRHRGAPGDGVEPARTLPVGASAAAPARSSAITSAGAASGADRSGRRSSASIWVGSMGRSLRWRCASAWMRAGLSSCAHSARRAVMRSRSRRISAPSLATRSAWSVDFELDLVDVDRGGDERGDDDEVKQAHRDQPPRR